MSSATASPNERNLALQSESKFLGQPRAVGMLGGIEFCQYVANGMMTAEVLYYLYAKVGDGGLGFSQTQASQLLSLYMGMVILCGLIGSYMADRVLGERKAVLVGRFLATLGFTVLALPIGVWGYALSMVLLCVATMMHGKSVEGLIGKMYVKGDKRRDVGFNILYVLKNLNAFSAVIAGSIAMATGYWAAFAVGAAFSWIGFLAYYFTNKKFMNTIGAEPDDPIDPSKKNSFLGKFIAAIVIIIAVFGALLATGVLTVEQFSNGLSIVQIFLPIAYLIYIIKSKKTTRAEAHRVLGLVPLYVCACFAAWVWTQANTILQVFAEQRTVLTIFGITLAPASFMTWSGIMSITWGTVTTLVWAKLGRRQPSAPAKVGFGTIMWGCGPLLMILPFVLYSSDVKVSPLWIMGFHVLIMLGEALSIPSGYSSAAQVAPAAFATQMMTVWSLAQSTGAALNAMSAPFYHPGGEVPYFAFIGIVTVALGVIVLIFSKKIAAIMGLKKEGADEEAVEA